MRRYDVWIQYENDDPPYLDYERDDDKGQWCLWEDVEKLIAERDEARKTAESVRFLSERWFPFPWEEEE